MRLPLSATPAHPTRRTDPKAPTSPGPASALVRTLDAPADYDAVFRVVRGAVRQVLGIERPGLGLGLSDLPPQLGAYWQVTGNLIVLNEGLVNAMRANARDPTELNSFIYVVLAHEYLHSLGYLDERSVREVTARVTRTAFGPDHPATRMAEGDLWRLYPFLAYAPGGNGRRLKVVTRFDLDTTDRYIR
ncbi:MAG TPA: hypothetical protein VGG32_06675 [Thermoplasmata archaeon]